MLIDRVVLFSRVELSGVIGNRMVVLAKYSSNGNSRCIRRDNIRKFGVCKFENRWVAEKVLDFLKGFLVKVFRLEGSFFE